MQFEEFLVAAGKERLRAFLNDFSPAEYAEAFNASSTACPRGDNASKCSVERLVWLKGLNTDRFH